MVGIVDSFHKPARGILLQVPDRTAPTMDQFITNHVLRGSTIHSDMWRSYNKLADLGYVHHTVNHSTHFVDALTGVHTQKIESSWNKLKLRFKAMKGVSKEHMDGYLTKRMFLDRYGGSTRRIFIKIIALLTETTVH